MLKSNHVCHLWWVVLLLASSVVIGAPTPAGTIIKNQASASYRTQDGQLQTVTSNLVETTIKQVPGLSLEHDQNRAALQASSVTFTHRITNTGNGSDRFNLQLSNVGTDDFDLSALMVFADANTDGLADSSSPITTTPWLAAGSDFNVVLSGLVPSGLSTGSVANISLVATSSFDSSLSKINQDTVTISEGAIIELSKTIDAHHGPSPSGPHRITLSYTNVGNSSATEVTLIDALPEGMSYIPGTAQWSESSLTLTDSNPGDLQGSAGQSIRYCAYHSSCTGLPEANTDSDSNSTNQITAIISSLSAGSSGEIRFSVEIDPSLQASVLTNIAEFEFTDNGNLSPRSESNSVRFTVQANSGVVANGSTATPINGMNEPVYHQSVAQGGEIKYDNIIWNTGNILDTYNIEVDNVNSTFPPGTLFQLFQSDGATPLQDSNNDGSVDTGPIAPGEYSVVVLKLKLPGGVAGNNAGSGYDLTKTARSVTDAAVFDAVTDHLDEIIANQVDITNQAPAGSPGALGAGPGPEFSPVSSVNINQAGEATFDLHVRHQGSSSDSYDLYTYSSSTGNPLPAGWNLVYREADSAVPLTSTGPLQSGESIHIIATLSIPADAASGTFSLFFEARSPTTGIRDIKHDAVIVDEQVGISLTPNLSAQLQPGGSVVYRHLITNTGTSTISDLTLTLSDDQTGWTSLMYQDSDSDDELTSSDTVVSGNLTLTAGEFQTLFVKVFAPASANLMDVNTTLVTANWASATNNASVTDISTVNRSHVTIRKEQVPDTGCDGQPDPGLDFGPGHIEVAPGNNCIIYRLTATNHGVDPSYNVAIHDYTPPFTRYRLGAVCSRSPCWISQPESDQTGTVKAETDQLLPGDGFYLQFSVSVE